MKQLTKAEQDALDILYHALHQPCSYNVTRFLIDAILHVWRGVPEVL